ncbi:long-chain N-acyl amino acid synthase [Rubrivivax gelatinosus]|nr:long-chain N-acyl amino acid synthase [Rubrivivax gelatinosus]
MTTDTIIVAPIGGQRSVMRPVSEGRGAIARAPAAETSERVFRIRSADSYVCRQRADSLLRERYAWRGYHAVSLPSDQTTNRITLSATENDDTIGTITVALDSAEGLSAEDAFPAEMEGLRASNLRVCEFTKLAIDPISGSKRVLAALFHVAYIVAHRIRGYDALVMEVNPRHVRYYERMLGARIVGEERLNRFVNAPAVLLTIDFDYIRQQIEAFGGRADLDADERSLYPYAFSSREEQGILARLMNAQTPASASIN